MTQTLLTTEFSIDKGASNCSFHSVLFDGQMDLDLDALQNLAQDPSRLEALLASVAPNPTRDVQRKTLDPQKEQDLFADVLNNYCDPTVQHDFDQLGAEAKRKMLKALQVTIEETPQSVSLNKMMKAASQGVNAASQDVKTCPITRALSLHQSCSVNREVIDLLRTQILPLWGSIVPKPILGYSWCYGVSKVSLRTSIKTIPRLNYVSLLA